MNDKMKEILEYLKDKNDYIEDFGISYKRIYIDNGDLKLLLDYITNLQNRITELEEINKQHQELNGKLRKIIYEARKMIFDNYGVLDKYEIDMLDDILQGSDKE